MSSLSFKRLLIINLLGMCLETSHVGGMIRLAKKLSSCLFLILWQVLVKARDDVRKRPV